MTDWKRVFDISLWTFAITGTMIFVGYFLWNVLLLFLTWGDSETQALIAFLQLSAILGLIFWVGIGTAVFIMKILEMTGKEYKI